MNNNHALVKRFRHLGCGGEFVLETCGQFAATGHPNETALECLRCGWRYEWPCETCKPTDFQRFADQITERKDD